MGAPIGNVNALKNKPWGDALRRCLARREQQGGKALNAIAEVLTEKALEGDLAAIKELGDRLDGKPAQTIGGDPESPLTLRQVIESLPIVRRDNG